jgi:thiosulfate dehydrogenase [quinone] large subunit
MNDKVLSYTLLRLFMGLLMFMHGAVRLGSKYEKFISWAQNLYAETWIPQWLVTVEAMAIPGVEMIIGVLLLLGFQTRWALIGAFGLMATLLFGMIVLEDWAIVSRHIIYALTFYILLHNLEHNQISMDARRRNVS